MKPARKPSLDCPGTLDYWQGRNSRGFKVFFLLFLCSYLHSNPNGLLSKGCALKDVWCLQCLPSIAASIVWCFYERGPEPTLGLEHHGIDGHRSGPDPLGSCSAFGDAMLRRVAEALFGLFERKNFSEKKRVVEVRSAGTSIFMRKLIGRSQFWGVSTSYFCSSIFPKAIQKDFSPTGPTVSFLLRMLTTSMPSACATWKKRTTDILHSPTKVVLIICVLSVFSWFLPICGA